MPRSAAKTPDARDRLLQVARRRFAVDGALVTTLDEVRREAEVSVGALYHQRGDARERLDGIVGAADRNGRAQRRARGGDQSQIDFELEFFGGVLGRQPDYVDVLRVMGNLLTLKGRFAEGLHLDKRLVQLRPNDALAHYNLACSFALMKQLDQSLRTLRKAVELGYRDFRYMQEDHDLDSIRKDPRFRKLLKEFGKR